MTAAARELIAIVDALSEDKIREIVDFARFLQQQADDQRWERIINDPGARPKLDAFVADALREEPAEPLDLDKL